MEIAIELMSRVGSARLPILLEAAQQKSFQRGKRLTGVGSADSKFRCESVPVHTAAVTSELAAPTLQRGEPYPQQTSDCSDSCTGSHRGLKDLQGFAAIDGCGQSPASSPQ